MENPTIFFIAAGFLGLAMLVWDTIEVGRNDAANIVNAVFGARLLRRRIAVYMAGIAVVLGAWASSTVIETVRRGIFDPEMVSLQVTLIIFISVYITDTVLLYSFSAFGMPVSTTACLVFELLGAAFALGGASVIMWGMSGQVVFAIICSIIISGIAGFIIQKIFRRYIQQDCEAPDVIKRHGPWVAGFLLTGLLYFLMMKGGKAITFVQWLREHSIDALTLYFSANPVDGDPDTLGMIFGNLTFFLVCWAVIISILSVVLRIAGPALQKNLFAYMAILGMLAIGFAFGQNDLANCASPGIAIYMIITEGQAHADMAVPGLLLLGCGMLLFFGMTTQNAQRVTRAEVNTGSQGDLVRLYAPKWCIGLAKILAPEPNPDKVLAPEPDTTTQKKVQHYDALRASVITSVSASVIGVASGLGLPVSTTYVSFAAVISSGWADGIFMRGDAHLKLARTIWVVFCWFFSALIAAVAAGSVAFIIYTFYSWGEWMGVLGILVCVGINLTIRAYMKRTADDQEIRLRMEASERKKQMSTDGKDHVYASDTDIDEL